MATTDAPAATAAAAAAADLTTRHSSSFSVTYRHQTTNPDTLVIHYAIGLMSLSQNRKGFQSVLIPRQRMQRRLI